MASPQVAGEVVNCLEVSPPAALNVIEVHHDFGNQLFL
jgi:hypothetical protein